VGKYEQGWVGRWRGFKAWFLSIVNRFKKPVSRFPKQLGEVVLRNLFRTGFGFLNKWTKMITMKGLHQSLTMASKNEIRKRKEMKKTLHEGKATCTKEEIKGKRGNKRNK
jgi:hypothetical protein